MLEENKVNKSKEIEMVLLVSLINSKVRKLKS